MPQRSTGVPTHVVWEIAAVALLLGAICGAALTIAASVLGWLRFA
jgi:hypothetical protein